MDDRTFAPERTVGVRHGRDHPAPLRSALIIAGSVFISELLVMALLHLIFDFHPSAGLLDALLVTAVTVPLLQRLLVRPLRREIAEKQRAVGELRLQTAAVNATTHSVVIADKGGAICWTNPAFLALTGYGNDEVVGRNLLSFNPATHDFARETLIWRALSAGDVWRDEHVSRRKDGSLYTEEETITPVRDPSEVITHFVAVKSDCTERQRAESQLARQNSELIRLSKAESHHRQLSEALVQATKALNASLDLEGVFERILEESQRVLGCRMVAVMLLFGERIQMPRYLDVTGSEYAVRDDVTLSHFPQLRSIASTHKPEVVDDLAEESQWILIPGLEWARSIIVVPLLEKNVVTGFLAALSERRGFFGEQATAFLSAIAPDAAVALQNASLYRAEAYARRTAETLSVACLALSRSLDLHEVLQSLVLSVRTLVPYDGAFVALLKGDDHLAVKAAAGDWPQDSSERLIDVDDWSAARAVLRDRQSEIGGSKGDLETLLFRDHAETRSWLTVPVVAGHSTLGVCIVEKHEPHFYTTEHMRLAEVLVAQAAMAIHNAQLFEELKESRERLKSLSHRLVRVQESERHHVASELHDEAGQVLTSLKFGLRDLEELANDPDAVKRAIGELRTLTDSVQGSLHRLAMGLRPVSLDHLGLVVALTDYVKRLDGLLSARANLQAIGFDGARLRPDIEIAIYRIVQEALTNVIRHAHPSRVDVLLNRYPDRVTVTIEDDGVGFDADAAPHSGQLGLVGMRERCEMYDGRLQVESAPGSGTAILVEIPL